MKIKFLIFTAVSCLLTGCIGMIGLILKGKYSGDMAYNYIYGDAKVANEYIEKIVEAFNTNDRELLASLFPEHARNKIDNFDEKIDYIIRENKSWPGSIIRYKLDRDNDYHSSADEGKIQRVVYAYTTIEFADPKEDELPKTRLKIGMEIVTVDDFNENNVGIAIFAIDYGDFNRKNVDKEKDGYDIYAFGR